MADKPPDNVRRVAKADAQSDRRADQLLAQQMRRRAAHHRTLADELDATATKLDGGSVGAAKPVVVRQPKSRRVGAGGFRQRRGQPSVRQRVVELLDEADKGWFPSDIVDEYEHRGTPVHKEGSPDRSKNVRTALGASVEQGRAIRLPDGSYKSTKYTATSNGSLPHGPEVSITTPP